MPNVILESRSVYSASISKAPKRLCTGQNFAPRGGCGFAKSILLLTHSRWLCASAFGSLRFDLALPRSPLGEKFCPVQSLLGLNWKLSQFDYFCSIRIKFNTFRIKIIGLRGFESILLGAFETEALYSASTSKTSKFLPRHPRLWTRLHRSTYSSWAASSPLRWFKFWAPRLKFRGLWSGSSIDSELFFPLVFMEKVDQ